MPVTAIKAAHVRAVATRLWRSGYSGSIGATGYVTVLSDKSDLFSEALERMRRLGVWFEPGEQVSIKDIAHRIGVPVEEVFERLLQSFAGDVQDAPTTTP